MKTKTKAARLASRLKGEHDGERLLTPAEAADRLNVSERWVRGAAWAYQRAAERNEDLRGYLRCVKVGKHLRFDPRDLDAFIRGE